jgi:hypothetical protein
MVSLCFNNFPILKNKSSFKSAEDAREAITGAALKPVVGKGLQECFQQ